MIEGKTFLSTSSARRTTLREACAAWQDGISIHVLREEDDGSACAASSTAQISIHVLREEDDPSPASARRGF